MRDTWTNWLISDRRCEISDESSIHGVEDTDLRRLIASMRNRYEIGARLRHEQRGARSCAGTHLRQRFIGVGIYLADDIDLAVASAHVNPLARGIVVDVVDVAHCFPFIQLNAGARIQGNDTRRAAARKEDTPVRFIEGQSIVGSDGR